MKCNRLKVILKSKLALPMLAVVGLLMLVVLFKTRPPVNHQSTEMTPMAVTFIETAPRSIRPELVGHGFIEPTQKVVALAEVSAKVVRVSPHLKQGSLVNQGEVLVELDPADYQLALTQAKAERAIAAANLREIDTTAENLSQRDALIQENIALAQRELKRKRTLSERGAQSDSQVDSERQKLIQLRQQQAILENEIATLPARRHVLEAKHALAETKVTQAQRDLDRTRIVMPFTGRLTAVHTDRFQYVPAGQRLFEASGIDQMEVKAQFPIAKLKPFLKLLFDDHGTAIDLTDAGQFGPLLSQLGLESRIQVPGFSESVWRGQIVNLGESLDPQSHTLSITLTVDQPYRFLSPGKKPPLLAGMPVIATLVGSPVEAVVLPRHALHAGALLTADKQGRLSRVSATASLTMQDWALFTPGHIPDGTRVITSDVQPALDGLPLSLTPARLETTPTMLAQSAGVGQ
ncbi:efflux RND transporter periplasmic adaptor subunit [Photobacterium sp. 1_MG-2023]|uniref:efflux RND transporter periplasmic adaptor subunit n=1 Tax=Photobacterium sp. 1_MG-2023 TaxID=3062646 RepID=UPI0026E3EDFF|nr:biotin/lipoyl-binding protein [Photobacterium sp. 1_MG-2023]MDO6707528.1 biotin/lipoyl-binding protein [Photobacterium sp. 1_MG-2023]